MLLDPGTHKLVVSAVGQLSRPFVPQLPGIDAFRGPAFHSAEWDHDLDLGDRRVAGIGQQVGTAGPHLERERVGVRVGGDR